MISTLLFSLAISLPSVGPLGLIASIADAKIWYSIPLIIAVSLVYGATRHENLKEILDNAIRSAIWVVVFMAIIFSVIFMAGFWN